MTPRDRTTSSRLDRHAGQTSHGRPSDQTKGDGTSAEIKARGGRTPITRVLHGRTLAE